MALIYIYYIFEKDKNTWMTGCFLGIKQNELVCVSELTDIVCNTSISQPLTGREKKQTLSYIIQCMVQAQTKRAIIAFLSELIQESQDFKCNLE